MPVVIMSYFDNYHIDHFFPPNYGIQILVRVCER